MFFQFTNLHTNWIFLTLVCEKKILKNLAEKGKGAYCCRKNYTFASRQKTH